MGKYKIHISLIIILASTFVVFSPVLHNEFINLDDNKFITENPLVTGELENPTAKIFSSHLYSPWYKPLVFLSWRYEYNLSGGNPFLFHLNNLILHLINSILAFYILLYLLRELIKSKEKTWIFALFGALLFALHPMKVESVAWAMERKDVLFGFFLLSGLLCYIRFILTRRIIYIVLALCAYALGLLSKSMIIVFPLLLFLLDIAYSQTRGMKFQLNKLPFFLLMLGGLIIYGVLFNFDTYLQGVTGHTAITQIGSDVIEGSRISILDRIMVSSYRVSAMTIRFFFPLSLSLIYPAGSIMTGGHLPSWFFIYPLIIIVLLIAGFILRKKVPVLLISSLFFLIAILPVLGMPGDASSFIADRYTYIPSLGAILLIAYMAHWFYASGKKGSIVVSVIMLMLLGLNAYASHQRCKVFHDSITLWNDVIAKYPSAVIAWDNRGSAKFEIGDQQGAIEDYTQAIVLLPHQASLYNNRGAVYLNLDQYEQASKDLNHAIALNPYYFKAWYNLALTYEQTKNWQLAYNAFENAGLSKQTSLHLHEKMAEIALFHLKDYHAAIRDYSNAMIMNTNNAVLFNNRGAAYHMTGYHQKALADYNHALSLNSALPIAWFNAGMIEILHGDKSKGCEQLLKSKELGYTAATDSINKYCK